MTDEQTNEVNKEGENVDTSTKEMSDYDKLKEENDKMEQELLRKQTLRKNMAEEKLLSGESGGHQEPEKPKEISPTDYAKSVLEGKHPDGEE